MLNVCMHIFFSLNNISLFGVGNCVYRKCQHRKTLGIFYDVTVFFLNGLNNCTYVNQCHNVMGMGFFFFTLRTNASFYAQASFLDRFFILRVGFHELLLVKKYIVFDPQSIKKNQEQHQHQQQPCNLKARSIAHGFLTDAFSGCRLIFFGVVLLFSTIEKKIVGIHCLYQNR